jgi:amidase
MKCNMLLGCLVSVSMSMMAQTGPPTGTTGGVTGSWIATADFYGATRYIRFDLEQRDEKLTGKLGSNSLDGTAEDSSVHFIAKSPDGSTDELQGTVVGRVLSGTMISTDAVDSGHPLKYKFTATLVPQRSKDAPQRHDFVPTVFYREYSALNKPVLHVNPGDTIHTTTVDAGGVDEKDVKRSPGGNPETGPFYIETAMPGDTLVVHLNRVRLNRDWAGSDDGIVETALGSSLAVKMKDNGKTILWHLDLAKGLATPQHPDQHLANYNVPLRPMLGCIATAVSPSSAPPPTGDSGNWGGNMDFSEVGEGATIYLPVANPGALLYLGDGHAAMGDGELNGNALETSMDVEFTVDVIPGKRIGGRRLETPTHLIAMGLQGSLDDAFREATAGMARWLIEDYKLNASEIAQVMGTAAEYRVSEVADRNSGIVLKISKERLKTLSAGTK